MSTTIRRRAAALGVAGLTGIAGIGIAAAPASAADAGEVPRSSVTNSVAHNPQSAGHPTNSLKYSDRLVRAYGVGSDVEVRKLATKKVADALHAHGDADATRWHRVSADSAAGSTYVAYTNLTTGETMTLGVTNERAAKGDSHAVRTIRFDN